MRRASNLKIGLKGRAAVLAMCSAFLPMTSACAAENRLVPWYVINIEGSALGRSVEDVFLFSQMQARESGRAEFWLVERSLKKIRPGPGGTTTAHDWIDGRTCPALASVLTEISSFPAMKLKTVICDAATGLTADAERHRARLTLIVD